MSTARVKHQHHDGRNKQKRQRSKSTRIGGRHRCVQSSPVLTCFCFLPLRHIGGAPGWVAATASISSRSGPPRARGCNGRGSARARADEDEDEDEEGAAAAIVSATAVSWRFRVALIALLGPQLRRSDVGVALATDRGACLRAAAVACCAISLPPSFSKRNRWRRRVVYCPG